MTDRELLEAAAKAAGHGIYFDEVSGLTFMGDRFSGLLWNPLHHDGDALRLAVKLRMTVSLADCCCCATVDWDGNEEDNEIRVRFGASFDDRECETAQEATRRAIVRAAAQIAPTPTKGPTP